MEFTIYKLQIKEKFYGQIKLLKLINKSKDMIRFISSFTILILLSVSTAGKVGINPSSPNAKSALDITSTSKGLLPPR